MSRAVATRALAAGLFAVGCGGSTQPPGAFDAEVVITSDPGRGVGGARLRAGGREVATTDAEGRARLSLRGAEGDTAELALACPPGFVSPKDPVVVPLRHLSPGSRGPSFAARCAPATRTVVIGIRAENGANLPVLYLGKEVARTDAWGAAHVVLSVKASEAVALVLDTQAGPADKRPRLRPQSPTLTFVARDQDDVVTLEQRFELERPLARPRAPGPRGPTRI
jgi:hypothetical protein